MPIEMSIEHVNRNVSVHVNKHVNRNVKESVNINVNKHVNRHANMNLNKNVDRNVNRNANRNVNENVNRNVNRNVSRECNFRYTTILLSKMKEHDKEIDPDHKETYRKRLHIPQNEKYWEIEGSPGARRSRCSFWKNSFVFAGENTLQR